MTDESKAKRSAEHIWHVWMNSRNIYNDHIHLFKDMLQFLSYGHVKIAEAYDGRLPILHQQCSRQAPVPIKENALRCCLEAMDVTKCPILLSLKAVYDTEKARIYPFNEELANPELQQSDEQLYRLMANTCAWHIFTEASKSNRFIDHTEGFLTDEGDRMFWGNVYDSLASGDPDEEAG